MSTENQTPDLATRIVRAIRDEGYSITDWDGEDVDPVPEERVADVIRSVLQAEETAGTATPTRTATVRLPDGSLLPARLVDGIWFTGCPEDAA